MTSFWRYNDVIITLCVRWVPSPPACQRPWLWHQTVGLRALATPANDLINTGATWQVIWPRPHGQRRGAVLQENRRYTSENNTFSHPIICILYSCNIYIYIYIDDDCMIYLYIAIYESQIWIIICILLALTVYQYIFTLSFKKLI